MPDNHATQDKTERIVLSGSFDSGFAMRLMVKDLETAAALVPTPGGATLSNRAVELRSAGLERCRPVARHTEIARYVERQLERLAEQSGGSTS